MPVDLGVFGRQKTIVDQQQLQQAFELKKLAAARQAAGGPLPAPLQLANEFQKRIAVGDIEGANVLAQFAKTQDRGVELAADGSYQPAQGYPDAIGTIIAEKARQQQNAKNASDATYKPSIAEAEAAAKLRQNLKYAPLIETAKTDASGTVNDATVDPLIGQLREYNKNAFSMPYSGSTLGIARLNPNPDVQSKVTNTDLLNQARLDMAAPLAKQLGVNPTDKDFQASLDRIFNLNASQASREAQINALAQRIEQRRAARSTRQNNDVAVREMFDNGGDQPPIADSLPASLPPAIPQEKVMQIELRLKNAGYTPEQIREYKAAKGM